ncbi:phage tail tape measure protein [Amorphus orientalis]|uniref:Phage-related minor tail protein n=1 Tax=Amorphus orientalis TaxID=649198 RepID=A0AAE3VS85_9HYPH|nr:phage tail tape measure protein [Amorphus orientalis]MDQ0317829.1 phage-related minor tail protein [Amorphus orientalis]
MADEFETGDGIDAARIEASLARASAELERSAERFSTTVVSGLKAAVIEGKRLDTILASAARSLSASILRASLKPLGEKLLGGFGGLGTSILGSAASAGVKSVGNLLPFAEGGVIGAPATFPLGGGRTGLAGEAGPEAVLPLERGPDGRLGVAAGGGGPTRVIVNITTPDVESFRRSEAQVTALLARAVARGRRGG